MKKQFLAVVAAATLLASCGGGGVSEETKKTLADFETQWAAAEKAAGEFGTALDAEITARAEMNMTVADSIKGNATEEWLAKADSIAAVCNGHNEQLNEYKTALDAFLSTWKADSQAWADWKNKVEKGEVKEEDVKKAMEEWNTKLNNAKASVESWNAALAENKTACEANCKAFDETVAAIAAAKPQPKGKGKK